METLSHFFQSGVKTFQYGEYKITDLETLRLKSVPRYEIFFSYDIKSMVVLHDLLNDWIVPYEINFDEFNDLKEVAETITKQYEGNENLIPIVGMKECSKIMGWTVNKLSVYHQRGQLPSAEYNLLSGPVFSKQKIKNFDYNHIKRNRGRTKKQ